MSLLAAATVNSWRAFFPFALDGQVGGGYLPTAPIVLANGTPGVHCFGIGDASNVGQQVISGVSDLHFDAGATITGTATIPAGSTVYLAGQLIAAAGGAIIVGGASTGAGTFTLGSLGTASFLRDSTCTWSGTSGHAAHVNFGAWSSVAFNGTAGNLAAVIYGQYSAVAIADGSIWDISGDLFIGFGTGSLTIGGVGAGTFVLGPSGAATFGADSTSTWEGTVGNNALVGFGRYVTITYGAGGSACTATGLLTYDVSATLVFNGTQTFNGTNTFGTQLLRQTGAWIQQRVTDGGNGDRTFTGGEMLGMDVLYCPAQGADHAWRIPNLGATQTVAIDVDGWDVFTGSFSLSILRDLDSSNIAVIPNNAALGTKITGFRMVWNGARWRVTSYVLNNGGMDP